MNLTPLERVGFDAVNEGFLGRWRCRLGRHRMSAWKTLKRLRLIDAETGQQYGDVRTLRIRMCERAGCMCVQKTGFAIGVGVGVARCIE